MDIHANRKAVEELNSLYAEMNGYKIEPPKEKLKTDRNMFNIPKSEQDAARERIKAKTAAKRAKMSEGDAADEASMKKFQALQKNVDQKRKLNIRGNDSAEQKARLEKKRGMKLDDHPQFKKEEVEVAEADSLAAMQARREKRLAAQRKREGTTASGRDFGHDYSLTPAQQKARRDAEFKAGIGTKKEEVEQVDEVNRAAMGRINKEYHRKKEAEAMAARKRDPKVKRDLPKRKNDNPMYDPKSAGSSRVKGFKFTPVKESWADAYKAVYEVDEAAKPDYLDFDKDGNKKESMKKALKDKKKGNPKHGMKGHKCDDDCDHDENGNGGDMSEAKDFIQKAIKRPGAFTAKAKERGMSAKEFASKVTANSKDYDERTVKQANLAKTLSGLKKEEQDFDAILQEVQKDGTPIEEALWIIANTTI